MRVLATGTAGFIGSRVAEMLLEQGHQVCGVDNLCPAYDLRLKHYRLERLKGLPGLDFHVADIADRQSITALWDECGPFDAVINLAARAGVRQSVENPWVYVETNMTGTLNLLELCRRDKVGKFVLASTSSLYGADNPVPFSEDADTNRPLSPYAASKKGAEALCFTYHHLYGIDVTVFRYFTVYGPAGRPDMSLFRFCQWIHEERPLRLYGDGSQSRDFTYVDDVARGTILGLKPVGYEVINLGGHEVISINEMIRILEAKIGKKAMITHAPFHPADVRENSADVTRAKEILGWEPQVSLDEGITNLVDWYMQEREWASQIETP